MRKLAYLFVLVALAISTTSFVTPAFAQATRTWVSGVGDDVNPCSRTAPCKTFAGAISKTATGGEINCLDPGGFGGVTITKSISIICGEVGTAGVLVSGTPGITVNAASAKVLLEGLDIEGVGTGTNGINIVNAATVIIRKCSIRNFSGFGVSLAGPAGTRIYLQDSQIINNAGGGFNLQGAGGAANNAVIERSMFDLNGGAAVNIVGPGQAVLTGNTLAFSNPSVSSSAGAIVISYTNNVFRNSSAGVTSTISLQ
jgi:Right handed beta helix region